MKIKIKSVDTPTSKYSSMDACIIYTEKYFRLKWIAETTEVIDNEDWNKKEMLYDTDWILKKENISAMEFGYSNAKKCYELEVVAGNNSLIFWYSTDDKQKGFKVYRELFKWWTGDELPEE